MSNYLAVATVTATLRRMLQGTVAADVSGATVTTARPDGSGLPASGVNLFLYHVAPNPDLRNNDLPTRQRRGQLARTPDAALDLHYLLSFYGDEQTLEAQRLLGSVGRTLHARPLISRQMIEDTLADPTFAFLAGSDLAEAPERVRLAPMGMTLEEQSQLWSGIFATTDYALSIAYRASVVLLSAEEETPVPALPVRKVAIVARTSRQPVIDTVDTPRTGEQIRVGMPIRIKGQRLRGEVTRLRVAGHELIPDSVSDHEIHFRLSKPAIEGGDLRAGVVPVQVLHPQLVGSPPELRPAMESKVAAFVLHPRVKSVTTAAVPGDSGAYDVTVSVWPPLAADQSTALLLNSLAGVEPPVAAFFKGPPGVEAATEVTFRVTGMEPGEYLLRVQIAGAESMLDADLRPGVPTFEQYFRPTVML